MLTSAIKVVDTSARRKTLRLLITPTGSYVTGGDTLDLTAIQNPGFLDNAFCGTLPQDSALCNAPFGYNAEFIPGTTLKNGLLKFFGSAGAEIAQAAYPAGLLGDPVEYEFSGSLGQF
jgi:hypothetical protein